MKTIIINALLIAAGIINQNIGNIVAPDIAVAIVAIINVLIRIITSQINGVKL